MKPFWQSKRLAEMTPAEWESLCDGCGRCCLIKLEDAETGQIDDTDVACKLFDSETCRRRDYPNRQACVPDCVEFGARHGSKHRLDAAQLCLLHTGRRAAALLVASSGLGRSR